MDDSNPTCTCQVGTSAVSPGHSYTCIASTTRCVARGHGFVGPLNLAARNEGMALFAVAALLALCVISQQPSFAAAQSARSRRRSSGQTQCPDHAHARLSGDGYSQVFDFNGAQCVCDVNYVRANDWEPETCVLDSTRVPQQSGGSFDGDIGSTSCQFTGSTCYGSANYETAYCSQWDSGPDVPGGSSVCWEGRCYHPSSCLPGEASAADRQRHDEYDNEAAASAQRKLLMLAVGGALGLAAVAILCWPGSTSDSVHVGVVLPRGTAVHGMMHISHIDNSCCGDQTSGCAWYTDVETCLLAWFCPCVLYGLNRERAGLARTCCGDCVLFTLLPTIMFFVMMAVIKTGHDVVTVRDIGTTDSIYRLAIEFVVVLFTPSMVLGGLQARNRTQLRLVTQGQDPTGWKAGLCGSADSVFLYIGSYIGNTLLPFVCMPPLLYCLVVCANAQVRGLPTRPIVRSRASFGATLRWTTISFKSAHINRSGLLVCYVQNRRGGRSSRIIGRTA